MIDYVLKETNQSKLFYIGHSQGTTSFFVMCSEKSEYNDKIRLMSALSPVVYMSRMTNPFFKLVANFHDTLEVYIYMILSRINYDVESNRSGCTVLSV